MKQDHNFDVPLALGNLPFNKFTKAIKKQVQSRQIDLDSAQEALHQTGIAQQIVARNAQEHSEPITQLVIATVMLCLLTALGWLWGRFGVLHVNEWNFFMGFPALMLTGCFITLVDFLNARIRTIGAGVVFGVSCGIWIIATGHLVAANSHADSVRSLIEQNPAQFPASWAQLEARQQQQVYLERELGYPVTSRVWGHLEYRAQTGIYTRGLYPGPELEREAEFWSIWIYRIMVMLSFCAGGGYLATRGD